MTGRGTGRTARRRLIAAALLVTALGAIGTAPHAGAAVPLGTPAFYTWQAPFGESTAGQRVVALTFDDGPSIYTPAVLADACAFLQTLQPGDVEAPPASRARLPNRGGTAAGAEGAAVAEGVPTASAPASASVSALQP